MRRHSPYNYAYNNPVGFIDPDGRKPLAPEDEIRATMAPTTMLMFYAGGGSTPEDLRNFIADNNGSGTFQALMGYMMGVRSSITGGGGGSIIGSGPGPKDNTGPGIIQSIGNFLSNLFGGKKSTATGHQVKFSIVDIALIPEGAVGGSLSTSLQGIGTGLFSTAGLTAGAIFFPTMIGEPEFNWAKQFDTPVDIPVTTTDNIPEKTMTLFRGVHSKHPDLSNAYMGMAIPWGGSATALQHNRGVNNSMFTSWTMSIDMANYSAYRRGPGGVILKQSFPVSRLSFFDRYGENEVQVFGPVTGAQVIKPWDFGTWKPYLK